MLVIWKGRGYLALVYLFAFAIAAQLFSEAAFGDGYYGDAWWPQLIAGLAAGTATFLHGRHLNRPDHSGRVTIGRRSGMLETDTSIPHTLFGIPMQWWSIAWIAIGVVYAFIRLGD